MKEDGSCIVCYFTKVVLVISCSVLMSRLGTFFGVRRGVVVIVVVVVVVLLLHHYCLYICYLALFMCILLLFLLRLSVY